MLTAYADVKNAIEALKLGASDFVSKPYDLEDILTSINRALGR
jgi:FixJ family two-component response regulator